MPRTQRKDNRVEVDWTARLGKRGVGVARGAVQNASISGLYVETTLSLKTGDHVMLEIQIEATADQRPILCEALIARKDAIPQRNLYGYGLQFTRIDDDALQTLFSVITELWALQQSDSSSSL